MPLKQSFGDQVETPVESYERHDVDAQGQWSRALLLIGEFKNRKQHIHSINCWVKALTENKAVTECETKEFFYLRVGISKFFFYKGPDQTLG